MDFARFHNALRVLVNLDLPDLAAADVIRPGDYAEWQHFYRNPHLYFIQAPDAVARRLWALIEARQPAPASAADASEREGDAECDAGEAGPEAATLETLATELREVREMVEGLPGVIRNLLQGGSVHGYRGGEPYPHYPNRRPEGC